MDRGCSMGGRRELTLPNLQFWVSAEFPPSGLTSHFNFKEKSVLKKKMVQMTGQIISPSQKIRASTSVGAATLEATCEGQRVDIS